MKLGPGLYDIIDESGEIIYQGATMAAHMYQKSRILEVHGDVI